jgi:hypothetical protein
MANGSVDVASFCSVIYFPQKQKERWKDYFVFILHKPSFRSISVSVYDFHEWLMHI